MMDMVVYMIMGAGLAILGFCLIIGAHNWWFIKTHPKKKEDGFARAVRMLREAQDEEKKLLLQQNPKNELKLRANQCLQGILIRELDKEGLKMQQSDVTPAVAPPASEDFSYLLKKKIIIPA